MGQREENEYLALKLREEEMIDKARRGGLKAFTSLTFPEYDWNWHHVLTCRYLNLFLQRKIRRLMIFEPPRHGKSELTSRRVPALIHGLYPHDEIMAATYNAELAADMTADVQRIMDLEIYQKIFPETRIMGENQSGKYARNKSEHELIPVQGSDKRWFLPRGSYRSNGVGGSFTGRGCHWLLIDDPIKGRVDADSKAFRDKVWKYYTGSLRNRLEGTGSILITLTRWHNDDLVGRLLQLAKNDPHADQWTILSLPAFREDMANPEDPRALGAGLWPGKFSQADYLSLKAQGERDWASLFQQRPTVEGGNILKKENFRYWEKLPDRFDEVIQSWDMATKDKQTSDYYVGTVWGRKGADKYLLDLVRGRWSFPTACDEVVKLSKKWPMAHRKYIEAKANGPAIVQTLKSYISGLIELEPSGDKIARVHACSPEFESGNVYFPKYAKWLDVYESELLDFPAGINDDQVDSTSQALNELKKAKILAAPITGHGSGVIR